MPVPKILRKYNPSVTVKGYALIREHSSLHIAAAESEGVGYLSKAVDDSVAGDNSGAGVDMERIAHYLRPAGIARQSRNLTVGCDPSLRNFAYNIIYFFKSVFHANPCLYSSRHLSFKVDAEDFILRLL